MCNLHCCYTFALVLPLISALLSGSQSESSNFCMYIISGENNKIKKNKTKKTRNSDPKKMVYPINNSRRWIFGFDR